ncbi:hypothetical protein V499_01955 [Pseudogymnoascus sp. VKM F-103]|nr:hypothetical protein V499_01955 [Pseudogymnoascus sp. VKM F-103]
MMNSEKETESAQSSADIDTPPSPIDIRPDGGLEAWMVVAGAWGACFCSWGWINSWRGGLPRVLRKKYPQGVHTWHSILDFMFGSLLPIGPTLNCVVGYFDKRRSTAFGIVATGSSTGGVVLPIMAVSMGMDRRLAQYLVAIINGSSTVGRLGAGVLADVYGPFNAWIAVTYAAGILVLSLWIPTTNDASTIAFASLFGICFGAYAAIQPALVAQITPIADIGICTGLYFSLSAFSQLVSGPIAGHTLETSGGSYLEMKIMAGFLCLAGATFVLGAKLYATGYKLMAKF